MVVAAKNQIHAQFVDFASNCITEIRNTAIGAMSTFCEEGVVQYDDLPSAIRVGSNCIFHKSNMTVIIC